MGPKNQIIEYVKQDNGDITATQVTEKGIHRQYLKELLDEQNIERTSRGVYNLPEEFDDNMFALQHRFHKGIYSHGTSLFLHGLTDRTPLVYTMTFLEPYNTTNVKSEGINVYRSFSKYYKLNIVSLKTANGNTIKTYDMEKTLCDILRSNSKVNKEEVVNAFKMYVNRTEKNISKLMKLSHILGVNETVKMYLEVLL